MMVRFSFDVIVFIGHFDVAIFKMETWWVASKTAYQLPNARKII